MSEYTVRRCDECEAPHGQVNNWWCVMDDPTTPLFMKFEQAEVLTVTARNNYGPTPFRLDYCSHACVGTAFHRWLDTGNVVRLNPEPGYDSCTEYAELLTNK